MASSASGEDGVLSWLNKGFIEAILRRDVGDTSLSVVRLNTRPGVAKGENNWSVLLRAHVEFTVADCGQQTIRCSLIVKSRPHGQLQEKWLEAVGHFRREVQIYHRTLPEMYRILKEETGRDADRFTPKVYECDRPDTLVMQDLKTLGYRMVERCHGMDLQHSKVAMKTLAKLHGLSLALHAKDPASVEGFGESLYTEATRVMQNEFMFPFYSKLATAVASWPGWERFEKKIQHISNVELNRMIEMVQNKPGSISVLNHGDFWTNNILFRYDDDDDDIIDVKLVDFQVVRFASPVLDIIYFLNTSLSQQVLEDHADELVDCYHVALCDVMRRLHCPPELLFSRQQLDQEMADKRFYAVVVSCKLCLMVAEPTDTPDFSTLREDAVQKGVDDMSKIFQNKCFKEAFQKRLLRFEAEGII